MYNTISLLQYVFWKVSTIFFPKYKSRNCQNLRQYIQETSNPLQQVHLAVLVINPVPQSLGVQHLHIPWAPMDFQEPRISLCTSVPTTKLFLKVLLSSSGWVLGWIIVPSNSLHGVHCSCQPAQLPTITCCFALKQKMMFGKILRFQKAMAKGF